MFTGEQFDHIAIDACKLDANFAKANRGQLNPRSKLFLGTQQRIVLQGEALQFGLTCVFLSDHDAKRLF